MNIEVEIKIPIDNFEEIKAKVSDGGKLIKSIRQVDEYYVPVHRDFFAKKPQPTEWLRIRTNPNKVIFEYDKSISMKVDGDYDYAEEYETEISSPDELRKILEFLNFKKVVTVDKQREYWDCGDLEIVLDKIANLGNFIEIEAKGDFKDSTQAKIACFALAEKMGIKNPKESKIKIGYPLMLLRKMKKTQINKK